MGKLKDKTQSREIKTPRKSHKIVISEGFDVV